MQTYAAPFRNPVTGETEHLAVTHDVSEHKQAEHLLRRSEERFRLVAEATNDVLWDRDLVTKQQWWSPNACDKFGYGPAAEPGIEAWSSRLHQDDRAGVLKSLDALMAGEDNSWASEYRFRLADGSYGYFMDRGHIVRDVGGKPVRMIGAMIDVTGLKQAYASLEEAYERLRQMSLRLQTAESNERRRLSRELHDEVGQLLTALKFDLEAIKKGASGKPPWSAAQISKRVRQALETTGLLFTRLRRIVRALRPPVLEELGIKDALHALGLEVQMRTGIAVTLVVGGEDLPPNAEPVVETALYRVAQELLTNVTRHAQATQVSVTLTVRPQECRLVVGDDGIGFEPTTIPPENSVGLRGIRERVEIFGGSMDIVSRSGEGTTVEIRIPRSGAVLGHAAHEGETPALPARPKQSRRRKQDHV